MKWCCGGFQGLAENAGGRGFGIVVDASRVANPWVLLQFKAIAPGQALPIADVLLTLESELVIHYCPTCGRDLARWYGKDLRHLSERSPKGRIAD
jgi:hypothetical protein